MYPKVYFYTLYPQYVFTLCILKYIFTHYILRIIKKLSKQGLVVFQPRQCVQQCNFNEVHCMLFKIFFYKVKRISAYLTGGVFPLNPPPPPSYIYMHIWVLYQIFHLLFLYFSDQISNVFLFSINSFWLFILNFFNFSLLIF